jgi:hypothetical protein
MMKTMEAGVQRPPKNSGCDVSYEFVEIATTDRIHATSEAPASSETR